MIVESLGVEIVELHNGSQGHVLRHNFDETGQARKVVDNQGLHNDGNGGLHETKQKCHEGSSLHAGMVLSGSDTVGRILKRLTQCCLGILISIRYFCIQLSATGGFAMLN